MLDKYLSLFRRRLKLLMTFQIMQSSLWIPAFAGLIIQLIGRFIPILNLIYWTVLPILLWLASILLYAVVNRISLINTAHTVDQALGLKERLSTAHVFELLSTDLTNQANNSIEESFRELQHLDALRHAEQITPSIAFPFRFVKKPMYAAVGLFTLICLSIILPNRMDQVIKDRQAVQQIAAEQAEIVENFKQDIQNDEKISPETRQELLRQLEELALALRENRGDLEQTFADLTRFERQINKMLDPDLAGKESLQAALSIRLSSLANKKIDLESPELTQQVLNDLANRLGEMTGEERDQLSTAFSLLAAQASQTGEFQLANSLADLAKAIKSDSLDNDLSKTGQTTAAAIKKLSQRLADQNAIKSALNQGFSSRKALASSARSLSQASSMNQTPGLPAGNGPGLQPGQGGGTQAKTLPPAVGGKGRVNPQGRSPSAQTGKLDEQIYAPWSRPAANGEQLVIRGQEAGPGETITTEGQGKLPGLNNPALMPYSLVYFQYSSAANQALQQGRVPPALAEYIRQYFSSLEPE